MDVPVIVNATRADIIAAIVDTGAPMDGVVIRLWTNDIVPSRVTLWADLTEATFTGYAASAAVVWGTPWIDELGVWHVTPPSHQFTASGTPTPEVIYGYALTTSGGSPELKTVFRFADPVPINQAGDAVIVQPDFPYPSAP